MAEQTKNLYPCTFAYDLAGRVQTATQGDTAVSTWDSSLSTVTFDDNDTPTGQTVFFASHSYLISSGKAVLRPYLTTAQATASGITTVTATLHNATNTPPSTIDFTVAGSTVPIAVSSGGATLDLSIDPILSGCAVELSAAASGAVSSHLKLSSGSVTPLMAIAPNTAGNTSSTAYRVTTASKAYAQGYYMGQIDLTSMAQALSDLQTMVQILAHTLYSSSGVVDALTQASYTPITLSTNEDNAYKDIQANLLPNLGMTLDTVYPSGGTEIVQYSSVKSVMPNVTKAAQDYATFVADTPGLI